MPDAEPPVVVQRGLWYDELEVGTRYRHSPGRTISEADNTWFSAITMNQQALHVDAVFAAESEFGGRLVNSMMTLAVVVGLSANHLTQGTVVANLGFGQVRFPRPVRAGDTLRAETVVTDKRESRGREGQGIVTLQHYGYNQDDKLVVEAERTVLWRMEPR
ncbi:MAG TPA: MaoC family dehydratase [Actinomycetes bacterium]|nr:MaoC family dehydratase [Actinomycetes bacterium]